MHLCSWVAWPPGWSRRSLECRSCSCPSAASMKCRISVTVSAPACSAPHSDTRGQRFQHAHSQEHAVNIEPRRASSILVNCTCLIPDVKFTLVPHGPWSSSPSCMRRVRIKRTADSEGRHEPVDASRNRHTPRRICKAKRVWATLSLSCRSQQSVHLLNAEVMAGQFGAKGCFCQDVVAPGPLPDERSLDVAGAAGLQL